MLNLVLRINGEKKIKLHERDTVMKVFPIPSGHNNAGVRQGSAEVDDLTKRYIQP